MSERTLADQTDGHGEPGAQLLDARGERSSSCAPSVVRLSSLRRSGHRTRQDAACAAYKAQDTR